MYTPWGYNAQGELGNGTTSGTGANPTPIPVDPTDLKNIIAVSGGATSSYALSSDGSLWVWGNNANGQLGLGVQLHRLHVHHAPALAAT